MKRHMHQQNMRLRLFLLIFNILFIYISVSSQEIESVQVSQLSDSQVKQVMNEIKSRGLTIDQATTLAKAKGASQIQIDQMVTRLNQLGSSQTETNQEINQQLSKVDTTLSVINTEKTDLKSSDYNQKIFGFQLFNSKNLSFESSINVPIPDNYVVGIGDQIQVNVWGASQQNYLLQVDNNGTIIIPDLGSITVAGKELKNARQHILNRLSAIYSDMSGEKPSTFASVSLTNIRSIQVNVIGEVIAPGTYTIPATASAFNALYLSGGPNENGSFRNIKLIRNNKTVKAIDVYEYLINGNSGENILLRDQDILMIPPYKKRVELAGEFKKPGIFEIKGKETLGQLINFAGGFAPKAFKKSLSVTRLNEHQLELIDVAQDQFAGFIPQNGDSVNAGTVLNLFENRVSIEGAISRPGNYSLADGLTLRQLIAKADGVRKDYYSSRGLIIRLDDQLFPTTIPFDVKEVLSGKTDYDLQPEDQVLIKDIFSMGEQAFINIYGEVLYPGKFSFTKNMTLEDLIFLAGGFTEAASQSYIEVARRNSPEEAASINNKMVRLFQFNIDRSLKLNPEDQFFTLEPFDHVYVRKAPSYFEQKTVSIEGEVKYPGQYSISKKTERISDILKRAGGLTPDAYIAGARLDRNTKSEMQHNLELIKTMEESDSLGLIQEKLEVSRLELKLDEIIKKPASYYDYVLREGDKIYIPKRTDEIWVTGEVLNPIGQAWESGKTLKYYINRAGGFSTNAKRGKTYIIYSDGTTKVTKSFFGRNYPKPEPGCQVIIPAKPPKPEGDHTTKWLSIASAFSSIAIAIAAVLK